MSLEHILASITALSGLRHLAQALGFALLDAEGLPLLPPTASPGSGDRSTVPIPFAHVGDFTWLAAESADPAALAARLVRRMAAQGRVAGLFVVDPSARRLAVAVAFGERPVLDIGLTNPDAVAIGALARLTPPNDGPEGGRLGYAARVADALAAERVGHRFFRQFRSTLTAMADGLPSAMRRADRHDFALLQLTRVLFLYFVQTKGWLAGQTRFLGNAVDHCLARGRRVHRDLLRPLFFGTLNRPPAERSRAARAFGAIPFLNGGLFEPHSLERRYRVDLPNHLWREAFDQLFEGFHFAVAEGDRHGAVAPDMLGRVFEGVMDPEVRRSTGTFYTPAALVERLVEGALAHYLTSRLACGIDVATRRLAAPDAEAAAVLDAITILDPAVGSGAFLLGALERLARLDGPPSAARKRRILQRNLFGIDRNATAVRLTELRLWLAVIADDPSERGDDVTPLPNLDCLVRQGDSLFDPAGVRADGPSVVSVRQYPTDLASLRAAVVTAFGPRKARLVRELRAVELELLAASAAHAETRLRRDIATCVADARAPDLFGRPRGLDRALREQLRHLRTSLHEIRRARRLIDAGEVPWFHYQSQFADIFARANGFDLVDHGSARRRSLSRRAEHWRRAIAGGEGAAATATGPTSRSRSWSAPSSSPLPAARWQCYYRPRLHRPAMAPRLGTHSRRRARCRSWPTSVTIGMRPSTPPSIRSRWSRPSDRRRAATGFEHDSTNVARLRLPRPSSPAAPRGCWCRIDIGASSPRFAPTIRDSMSALPATWGSRPARTPFFSIHPTTSSPMSFASRCAVATCGRFTSRETSGSCGLMTRKGSRVVRCRKRRARTSRVMIRSSEPEPTLPEVRRGRCFGSPRHRLVTA